MRPASTRLGRLGLAFWTAIAAYMVSPLARLLPVATVAAAEDGGLGAGGAAMAYNYVLAVSVILAFILGFAIRDVLHRHSMKRRSAKKPAPVPPRA